MTKIIRGRFIAFFYFASIILTSFSGGMNAQADAVIVLKGELYSINQNDIQIKEGSSIFRVSRSELSTAQKKQLEEPGVSGKIIRLVLPMSAIKKVRYLNPQMSPSPSPQRIQKK
jgi:hypothetical protein